LQDELTLFDDGRLIESFKTKCQEEYLGVKQDNKQRIVQNEKVF
jgi:hypothetical protein